MSFILVVVVDSAKWRGGKYDQVSPYLLRTPDHQVDHTLEW
ncbi:hypothetical protein [Citrobacter braakii]|nr:hypothetical protein [Citrobacter braakii]